MLCIRLIAWSTAEGLITLTAELKAKLQKLPQQQRAPPDQQKQFIQQALVSKLESIP